MSEYDFIVGGKRNGKGLDKAVAQAMDDFDFYGAWGWTYLHRVHVEAFRKGGHQAHGGKAWKPLASSTVKAKSRKRRGGKQSSAVGDVKILVDSGTLRRLEVETSKARNGKYIVKIQPPSEASYAFDHQHGNGRVPQRKVISITQKDKDNLKAFLKKTLKGSIGRSTDGRN